MNAYSHRINPRNLPSGSDDKSKLGFGLDEEVAGFLGVSSGGNKCRLLALVLLVVLLSIGSDCLSLVDSLLSVFISLLLALLQELGISRLLFLDVFRHNSKQTHEN